MNIPRRSLAAVAAVTLLLAACGDDDTGGTSTEPAGAAATEPVGAEVTTPPADTAGAVGRGGDYYGTETESAPPATEAGEAPAGAAEIVISGFAFSDDITVTVGTTVVVRNDDSAGHTWTADDGAFDSGLIDAGATFEFTFTEAGTFSFHCEVHPSMTGTVTVTA